VKIKHIVYIDKSMKDKDLAILDKTLCTMKGAKIYEEYMDRRLRIGLLKIIYVYGLYLLIH